MYRLADRPTHLSVLHLRRLVRVTQIVGDRLSVLDYVEHYKRHKAGLRSEGAALRVEPALHIIITKQTHEHRLRKVVNVIWLSII